MGAGCGLGVQAVAWCGAGLSAGGRGPRTWLAQTSICCSRCPRLWATAIASLRSCCTCGHTCTWWAQAATLMRRGAGGRRACGWAARVGGVRGRKYGAYLLGGRLGLGLARGGRLARALRLQVGAERLVERGLRRALRLQRAALALEDAPRCDSGGCDGVGAARYARRAGRAHLGGLGAHLLQLLELLLLLLLLLPLLLLELLELLLLLLLLLLR